MNNSNDFCRVLFESAGYALLVFKNGHAPSAWECVELNTAAAGLFGRSRQELLGQTLPNLLPPCRPDGSKARDGWPEKVEAALSGQSRQFEERFRRPDGSTLFARVSLNPVRFAGDTYLQVSLFDITGYKQSETRFRQLYQAVEQSANTVVVTDTRGYIEYVNPKFTKTTGYSREEAIGQHTRILKSGETSSEAYRQLWETITAGKEWQGEFHNRRKNGELYWEHASISPIKDENGVITHFLAVKEDITARKQIEAALRESEERYSAVVNQAHDGIIIIQDNLCVYANESLATMLGYTPAEMENMPFKEFVAPESLPLIAARIKARLAGEDVPSRYEAKLRRKNGEIFDAELSAGIIQYRGKPADVGIIRNVTERKQAEAEIQKYQEQLEELVQARTAELEERLNELHALQQLMSREGWQEFQSARSREAAGYLFAGKTLSPLEAGPQPPDGLSQAVTQPLAVSGEPVGTLGVYTEPDHPLSASEQAFLEEVAAQTAESLERARLLEQLQTSLVETEAQAQRLALLSEMSHELAQTDAIEKAFGIAVTRLVEIVDSTRASIAIAQPDTGRFEVYTVSGPEGVIPVGSAMPIEGTAIGRAIQENRVVIVPDTGNSDYLDVRHLAAQGIRTSMVAPLVAGGQVLGTLNVGRAGGPDTPPFTARDERLMLQVASLLASTIESRRLFEQTQAALAEVEATQQRYTLQSWETYRARKPATVYEQTREDIPPLGDELPPEVRLAVAQKQPVAVSSSADNGASGASLVVPLTVRNAIIGVLGLQDTDERDWLPEEVALVSAIGQQVAQAAEQLRLLDETQQRVAREKRIGEIGDRIRMAQSLEEALQIAVREVGLSLKAPQTIVELDVETEE